MCKNQTGTFSRDFSPFKLRVFFSHIQDVCNSMNCEHYGYNNRIYEIKLRTQTHVHCTPKWYSYGRIYLYKSMTSIELCVFFFFFSLLLLKTFAAVHEYNICFENYSYCLFKTSVRSTIWVQHFYEQLFLQLKHEINGNWFPQNIFGGYKKNSWN